MTIFKIQKIEFNSKKWKKTRRMLISIFAIPKLASRDSQRLDSFNSF